MAASFFHESLQSWRPALTRWYKCRAAASVKEDNRRRRINKHYGALKMGSEDRMWDRTFQPSNTKRKPQSTHQFATFLHLTEEHLQYYWPLNRVSVETPTCSPTRCGGTMADAIWPLHKAGKHLCVQEQRGRGGKNEDRLQANWKKDWGRNGCSVEEGGRGKKQRNKITPCSTAPVISDIHKCILILVLCVKTKADSYLQAHCPT